MINMGTFPFPDSVVQMSECVLGRGSKDTTPSSRDRPPNCPIYTHTHNPLIPPTHYPHFPESFRAPLIAPDK